MADLTGVANSLLRRVSALTNEVSDLKRVVAEREEKIQRLEADLEAEKRGQQERRSEWYRRPDPYARSGGYERSDPYGYYDDSQRYPGYYSGEYRATPAAPSDPYAVPRQADGRNVAIERGGPARERGRTGQREVTVVTLGTMDPANRRGLGPGWAAAQARSEEVGFRLASCRTM